jgi:hypothetical protein
MKAGRSLLAALAMAALAACGAVPEQRTDSSSELLPCSGDWDCPTGRVCERSGPNQPTQCVLGCRADFQCGAGKHCEPVYCIDYPCPPLCL